MAELVALKEGAKKKEGFIPTRKGIPQVSKLSFEERAKLMKERPDYGTIVCRCENVSEGEIVDAIRRPLGARTVDAVKRRVRAGMGRCQGGFCGPKVIEILARELEIPADQVEKNLKGSYMVTGRNKKQRENGYV